MVDDYRRLYCCNSRIFYYSILDENFEAVGKDWA